MTHPRRWHAPGPGALPRNGLRITLFAALIAATAAPAAMDAKRAPISPWI